MSFQIPQHYLANAAAVFGATINLHGIYDTLNPRGALNILGFPIPVSTSDQKLVNGRMRMFASTRVTLGITTLAMWYFKNWRALGVSMVSSCVMAISDGTVSKEISGKGEWSHWGFAPVGTAIGIGLLIGAEQ